MQKVDPNFSMPSIDGDLDWEKQKTWNSHLGRSLTEAYQLLAYRVNKLTPLDGSEVINGNLTINGSLTLNGNLLGANNFVGMEADFAGTTAPTGWLLEFGQAISRTTYAALFAVTGTIYGVGDGTTTFNLPDKRGRVTAGQDNMGGTSANRLTGLSGGVDGDVLGGTGGLETHTLVDGQLSSHVHNTVLAAGTSGGAIASLVRTNTGSVSAQVPGPTSSTGTDLAHNNVQPTFISNKIIYTGVV